jgi:4-hydroxybenzoate polyprenyltransferase
LKKVIDFFIFSNLFIAVCAAAQGLLTYLLINAPAQTPVITLLFFSTLLTYNLSAFLFPVHEEQAHISARNKWISRHKILIRIIVLVSLVCVTLSALELNTFTLIILVFIGLLSFFYSFPLFDYKQKKVNLRNITGIKLFLIGFIWAVSCVVVPILESNVPISVQDILILFVKRFLFVVALTIPFDIRDIYNDREAELKTIPVMIGEKFSKIFCALIMVLCMILFYFYDSHRNFEVFVALSITLALTAFLIFKSSIKKNEYYYLFVLDGMLIVQYLTVLAVKHI